MFIWRMESGQEKVSGFLTVNHFSKKKNAAIAKAHRTKLILLCRYRICVLLYLFFWWISLLVLCIVQSRLHCDFMSSHFCDWMAVKCKPILPYLHVMVVTIRSLFLECVSVVELWSGPFYWYRFFFSPHIDLVRLGNVPSPLASSFTSTNHKLCLFCFYSRRTLFILHPYGLTCRECEIDPIPAWRVPFGLVCRNTRVDKHLRIPALG